MWKRMSLADKVRKFIYSPGKVAKIRNKIKNMPYRCRCRRLVRQVKNAVPVYAVTTEKRAQKIIVSMTSYPPRFPYLGLCLKSLLLQSVKPDHIILWLDCRADEVTQEMRSYEQYGITIRFVKGDLKPHKKYFFAMQEFPDDIIITVDDDVIYPVDTIESLIKKHVEYPGCVCARRVHKVTLTSDGTIRPYSEWIDKCRCIREPSFMLVPTGVGGVLYPPHCLDNRVFDISAITRHCLMADDIWLKAMELLKGTKVVWVPNTILTPPYTEGSQESSLYLSNVHENRNDIYIKNMLMLFGEELRKVPMSGE